MKTLTTYILCLAWVLAPLATLRAHPLAGFLAGAGPSSGTTYTLRDSVTGTTDGSYPPGVTGLNANAYGAEFVAGETAGVGYTLTRVDLPLSKTGSPTMTYTCEIFSKGASFPDALVGSASAAVNSSTFPGSEGDVSFYPTATLTNGVTYYIVLRASTEDPSNYAEWYRITTTGRVDVFNASGPAWTNATTGRRLKFKTYSSP